MSEKNSYLYCEHDGPDKQGNMPIERLNAQLSP